MVSWSAGGFSKMETVMRVLILRLLFVVCSLCAVTPASAGGDLVGVARRYIGTNPTGKRSLWCGNFMNFVLKKAGDPPSPSNEALSFSHYGRRVSGPQVGAIAVMHRRGGGHVGVVSAIDANGNPVIISGNHNHTVAESVYPRRRIAAYVMPSGN